MPYLYEDEIKRELNLICLPKRIDWYKPVLTALMHFLKTLTKIGFHAENL